MLLALEMNARIFTILTPTAGKQMLYLHLKLNNLEKMYIFRPSNRRRRKPLSLFPLLHAEFLEKRSWRPGCGEGEGKLEKIFRQKKSRNPHRKSHKIQQIFVQLTYFVSESIPGRPPDCLATAHPNVQRQSEGVPGSVGCFCTFPRAEENLRD